MPDDIVSVCYPDFGLTTPCGLLDVRRSPYIYWERIICHNSTIFLNISPRITRCCADAHALAPCTSRPAAYCLLAACGSVRRTGFLDAFHGVTLEFLFINPDFVTRPNSRCGLPNHNDIVFRRACRCPLFPYARCPAEIRGSGGMA